MSETAHAPTPSAPSRSGLKSRRRQLVLALLLAIALVVLVAVALARQPPEQITIARITLPRSGMIVIDIANDGAAPVAIAQVQVDKAFWEFAIEPGKQLPRFGRATIRIPYPWEPGANHTIRLFTGSGATFEGRLPNTVPDK